MAKRHAVTSMCTDLTLPNSSHFSNLLNQSLNSKSLTATQRVHARILKSRFASETFINNRLVDVYSKCGSLEHARKVFDKMPHRNVFTWNSVLTALMKWGFVDEAEEAFRMVPEPDQCSWNSMVSGFAQHGRFFEAVEFFIRMHRESVVMNDYTFGGVVKGCTGLVQLRVGVQVHCLGFKLGYSGDVVVGSALVDMYGKCGVVGCAKGVFDEMRERNVVSWNSLVSCYEQNGPASMALEVFVRMMGCGVEPDEVTLSSVVSACATLGAVNEGREIHGRIVRCDKFRDDVVIGNSLVDMYAKCNRINEARWVFDRMSVRNVVSETSMVSGYAKAASTKDAMSMFSKMMERNVVSWNALIAGYTQNGENEEALGLFLQLKRESVLPTHYTFGNLLSACANLADLQLGRQAHGHVLKHGFRFQSDEEPDVFVGNSLIDMYMKCGSVLDGHQIFERMVERDWVSWNAMIVGYAQNGYGAEALSIFRRMLESGEKPDHVTMIGVLCACSHAGLVEEGRHYFSSMSEQHGIIPLKDHYTCMVDLLGRAGCLENAKNFIEAMPMQPDAVVWGSLLGACKVHRNITLGKYVAEKLLEIDPTNSGPYVLLSNMYAELGRWSDVVKVRKLMRKQGVVKQPGCSWIEIQGNMHVFLVKDRRHPWRKEIYSLLQMLIKQMKRAGYVPNADDQEAFEEQSDFETALSSQIEFSDAHVE